MNIESSLEHNIEPIDEFIQSGGEVLERSDPNNPDSEPIKWICGKDENDEHIHIHPPEVTNPIYIYLDDEGRWVGTTVKPKDIEDWAVH